VKRASGFAGSCFTYRCKGANLYLEAKNLNEKTNIKGIRHNWCSTVASIILLQQVDFASIRMLVFKWKLASQDLILPWQMKELNGNIFSFSNQGVSESA